MEVSVILARICSSGYFNSTPYVGSAIIEPVTASEDDPYLKLSTASEPIVRPFTRQAGARGPAHANPRPGPFSMRPL